MFRSLLVVLFLSVGPIAMAGELQWPGHSACRIISDRGKEVLLDPFLTGNLRAPKAFSSLRRPGRMDHTLLTHGYVDHVGDAFALAGRTGAPAAFRAALGAGPIQIWEMEPGETRSLPASRER